MKRNAFVVSAATLAGIAGLAGSAAAALNITPSDIITWGGVSQGRAVPTPGGFTWAWNNTIVSNPQIDASGRVYFNGFVTSSPTIGSIAASQGPRGMFTATNSTDISLYNGLYDSADRGGGTLVGQQTSAGVFSFSGFNGNIWTSGNRILHGTGVQGTGIVNSGTTQNNSWLETSTFGGSSSLISQRNNTITLNSAGGPAVGNINTDFKGLSLQNAAMNSSGTVAWTGAVAAVAGVFVTTNPTAAPFGNSRFLAVTPAGGSAQVIAQGGDAAPGGGTYANGSSNGAGGNNVKMNRSGQVFFDGTRVVAGTVTTASDSIGMIYTPGSGVTRVYREGLVANDATGAANVDGHLHSGAMSVARRSFSDAGIFYHTDLTSGTNLNTTGINQNNSGLWIANTSGSVRVAQRNDTAPGFTPAQNVRIGAMNMNAGGGMNNNGFIHIGTSLQGEGVTANVAPVVSGGFPGVPAVVVTPGIFGNDTAVMVGVAGSLQLIARRGDPAPGTPGFSLDPNISAVNMSMNNANQVIFDCDVTPYQVGDAVGVTGQLLATSVLASTKVLYGWSAPTGLVPLMYVGQVMEVDTGIFKTVTQWTIFGESNGDGAAGAFNDLGQFAASVRFTDNSWSVIKLTVPAPSAGALALLGLGAMGRRRRRN